MGRKQLVSSLVHYRAASIKDIAVICRSIVEAGGGINEFLLEGVIPGMRITQLISAAVLEPSSPLHYSNAVIAERGGVVIAMALAYPSEEFGMREELSVLVPAKRLSHMAALFTNKVINTFYLHALWVNPSERGSGMGRELLDYVNKTGRDRGFDQMSLHVWADNKIALGLYEGYGFRPVTTIAIGRTEELNHEGGIILMATERYERDC